MIFADLRLRYDLQITAEKCGQILNHFDDKGRENHIYEYNA